MKEITTSQADSVVCEARMLAEQNNQPELAQALCKVRRLLTNLDPSHTEALGLIAKTDRNHADHSAIASAALDGWQVPQTQTS